MKNILLLTMTVSPYRGSEYAVGWNFIRHMDARNNLFVVYADFTQESGMDTAVEKFHLKNTKLFLCGARNFSLKRRSLLEYQYNNYKDNKRLHLLALKKAKEIIEKEKIDCVHFLNPIGFKEPSFLWTLNKPYVWGPVQAVSQWPFLCFLGLSLRGKFEFCIRTFFHNLTFFFNSRVRKAFRRADVLIAANNTSRRQIERVHRHGCLVRSENAIETVENETPIVYKGGKLNVIFAGHLNDRKGLFFVLKSLVLVKKMGYLKRISLNVYGDGYLKSKMKKFCRVHGLEDAVVWHGLASREDVQTHLQNSHLNLIPSLSEATSTILWEATSKGVPSLVLNHYGMADVLTNDSSFLIDVTSYNRIVKNIAFTLIEVLNDPNVIRLKSEKTIELARKYSWDNQIDFFDKAYDAAIAKFEEKNGKRET